MDKAPKGLSEDIVRFISAKKGEPEWMLEWRLDAYRRWRTMREPTWARVDYDADRLRRHLLLRRAEDERGAEVARRGRSRRSSRPTRSSASRCASRRSSPACELEPRRGRRGLRLGLGRHDLQGGAGEGRRDLHADLGGDPRASGARAQVPRHGRAGHRQLLRDAELGRLHRRLLRLRAAGRALPDGAVDLLPHQREEHRPVRAHADHRRQGLLRLLSRGLHGAAAGREPAPRRGGRAHRARRRRDQVLDGAELVSRATPRARAASTTS